jgi:hypothetical protein
MRFVHRWWLPGLAATLLFGLAGCANNQSSSPTRNQTVVQPHSGPSKLSTHSQPAATPTSAIAVKPVTWQGYQDTIKSLKGKVVLVDFWQTT